ncbi:hypothetical protein AK812_SmicGene13783 [Symbiodinium microadriaticum]|uniref:Uncharacterized protein n=1 Tax=Symbiodinium microadriaticum TaxID=2951 RepID=A0A1Q9E7A0_SYMMI|nr:hypothetical protein AK812_SmicGene13783 [Symbiodinium microadriaticum]CAE7248998.1 unnamed protein product [Symbiodinium sp. KB8]CAE7251189.1 unnamed protein product [Symbiodinium microadriaticum]
MRSSVRVDDNSHDLSWVQGVTPATLPPPTPLHPRTVLSMRGTATGSWRGTTWSPPSNSVVRHQARVEPTLVINKTLAGRPERGILHDGLHKTTHPAGAWMAATRFELGFARTARYWLVEVDFFAPAPVPDRIQLRTGESFWLEWRGEAADVATEERSHHGSTQQPIEDPQPDNDNNVLLQSLITATATSAEATDDTSFTLPNEYLTSLAYHACYYVSKLQSTNDKNLQPATSAGEGPASPGTTGPTAMVFCITNTFVEAEAALESLAHHHDELPKGHLIKELQRAEALLKDGRAIFKSWARDPNAPGALPGTAASQNALDGIDWSFLALEEGGVATLDAVLHDAWLATQRCNKYMDELLAWIEQQFQDSNGRGSPSPKRRRTEVATGSLSHPVFVNEDPARHQQKAMASPSRASILEVGAPWSTTGRHYLPRSQQRTARATPPQ